VKASPEGLASDRAVEVLADLDVNAEVPAAVLERAARVGVCGRNHLHAEATDIAAARQVTIVPERATGTDRTTPSSTKTWASDTLQPFRVAHCRAWSICLRTDLASLATARSLDLRA